MSTPYDEMPIEVRRFNWGWWGEPWPSGICENDDRTINWEMQREFPTGQTCSWCGEEFQEGDSGTSMPSMGADGQVEIIFQHKECGLRVVLGSYAHLTMGPHPVGECNHVDTGLSLREDALKVWEWTRQHGHSA